MRGDVRIEPFNVPNVDSITVLDTNTTPPAPTNRCATSAATRRDVRISSTGITARYATFASK